MTEGYKVKKIFLWSEQVWPDSGWKPWANTIAYYPLTTSTTTSDMSGNNRNLTQVDNSTFWTYLWVNCVYVYWNTQSWFHCLYNRNVNNQTLWNKFTVSFWGSRLNQNNNSIMCWMWWINGSWNWYNIYWNSSTVENEVLNNWSINKITYSKTISVWEWYLYTAVYDNWNSKLYVDWVLWASWNYTVWTINVIWVWITFGTQTTGYSYQWNWYLSNYILENKARTAADVVNYYNSTKWNYWL